jgi:uncharacterized membrane protein
MLRQSRNNPAAKKFTALERSYPKRKDNMARKALITLLALTVMALTSPTTVFARSGHGGGSFGGHGGFGRGGGFRGFRGRGFGFYDYGYYPYDYGTYYSDEGCYLVRRRVKTRHGWRIRRVAVCG